MKKSTLALAFIALMPMISAAAYGYSQAGRSETVTTTRRTSGYNNATADNFYYTRSGQTSRSARTGQSYQSNSGMRSGDYYRTTKKQTTTVKKSYSTQERKFFLAHPFFQPLQGHVGSVTDFSYAKNNFNFDLLSGGVLDIDPSSATYNSYIPSDMTGIGGKAENSQFAVKEDLSYGLTDTLSLVLMAQYDTTKTTIGDWSFGGADDTSKTSGLNLFGIGLQNRFVDKNNWIVFGEAFFQHQRKTANTVMGAAKVGYKIDRTTLYGIGRVAWTSLIDGDTYGLYIDDSTGDYLMLSYHTNVDNIFQFEGGFGAFAILNKYFTLNGELMFGNYDWHNQLNIKGAIGWQPADHFALNLYASTVLYDSAKNKVRQYMNYDVDPENLPAGYDTGLVYTTGDYKIKDYNEWKIGVQAILYF